MTDREQALANTRWRKSSYSGNGAQCVEVALLDDDTVAIRDSKNPEGGCLVGSRSSWLSFIQSLNH